MAEEYGGLKSNLKSDGWSKLGLVRVSSVIAFSALVLPFQYLMIKSGLRIWWPIAGFWHRTVCRIMGVKVQFKGLKKHKGPVLYAANHISWLDIIILGGSLKNSSFVAKSDIEGWGTIASLCKLQKTVFVNRERRTDSARQRDALSSRVQDGDSLILFPEGTSTDGVKMAPFKSALFSVAERADAATDHNLLIQPLTIAYTEMNGMPIIRSQKPRVAWLGDVELFEHLREFLGMARTVVTVEFHEPTSFEAMGSRKALAKYCEAEVRGGLERALRHEMKLGPREKVLLAAPQEAPVEEGV
ncbi:lysophospholipid acyltransferase family protein [Kordiimonas laminariae]|uniref:lysophospholipid acyltransferase family protein n=1 Tax=Kordiimonas laminariae TaxID=2917717 RepID=UPI001FF522FF|nr:lysophospholipid acyltransferase family protein [Kordiimonas laminariae]MCK0069313.1 1-acyl-sn-glycerol-3-phosphate acyltransferase [Kordiimonas laminariae]